MRNLVVIATILIGCVLLAECIPQGVRDRIRDRVRQGGRNRSSGRRGGHTKGLFCSITWFDGEQRTSGFVITRNDEQKDIAFGCPGMEDGAECNSEFSIPLEYQERTGTVFLCGEEDETVEEQEETEEETTEEETEEETTEEETTEEETTEEETTEEETEEGEGGAAPSELRRRGGRRGRGRDRGRGRGKREGKEICGLSIPGFGTYPNEAVQCDEGSSCSVERKSIFIDGEDGAAAVEIVPLICSKVGEGQPQPEPEPEPEPQPEPEPEPQPPAEGAGPAGGAGAAGAGGAGAGAAGAAGAGAGAAGGDGPASRRRGGRGRGPPRRRNSGGSRRRS